MDTCDYKPCSRLEQVVKKNHLQEKLHVACTITLIVGYHVQL